ncbi:MAG: macrocin-O-methyltransferase [Anaerolineae bacterium]|nr:MAG: macrocin-O-methyltransferase [Anaerolineae bacterium]
MLDLERNTIYRLVRRSRLMRRIFRDIAFWLDMQSLAAYKPPEEIALIRTVKRESDTYLTATEAYMVYTLARAQAHLPGEMAEVGVYRGGSSKLICEVKGDVPLHLFDTFRGLPTPSPADRGFFQPGMFASRLKEVQAYLSAYPQVHFHPGRFPETGAPVSETRFSFVHLDVDVYDSMKACLSFFSPRLAPGGVILLHDYQYPGVRQAVEEIFPAQEASVIPLNTSQCLVRALP